MFEIKKHPILIHHLKNISNIYQDRAGEIIIFCPYCNDATRKVNPTHGHLYISTHSPVFYCFRCNASGTILRLLIDTNFEDEETLTYISKLIGKSTRICYRINLGKTINDEKREHIKEHIRFKNRYKDEFNRYESYLFKRLGVKSTFTFNISPIFESIKGKQYLSCAFRNADQTPSTSKIIDLDSYKNYGDYYYFQKRDLTKYNSIVITEGVFDLLNLYLYTKTFEGSFFITSNGKNYLGVIESLMGDGLIFGEYQINIIFDSDYNFKNIMYKVKKISSYINPNLNIRFFKPLIGKDVGYFPGILEV